MNGLREYFWKVLSGITLAAAIVAASYAGTRASNEDVEHVEQQIQELRVEVNKRLRGVETNVIITCQFLDRQDKLNGGPGLNCKDSE
jgi:hypothetical protein